MAESTKTGSEEFGEMLRQARERRGMSRRDLAEATGLSYPYISQLETGYRMPSAPAMRTLADALGLRPDSLFDAIPPAAARDVAARPQAPEAVRSSAAMPMAPPPPAPASAPPSRGAPVPAPRAAARGPIATPTVRAAAGAAAGGGWIANPAFGSAADGPPLDVVVGSDAAAAGPMVQVSDLDRTVDAAALLLTSLAVDDRLDALSQVQARVVRSVVDEGVRRA